MPEHAGGIGYEDEEMALYNELCPRCVENAVKIIPLNGRKKDRKCLSCGVMWNHLKTEEWSIIGL